MPSFCYLGDCLPSGGGCEFACITRCHVAWGKWAPVRPHLPLISHHLQRKSLQFVRQERHATCKRNLGSNFFWLASPSTQWQSYDPQNVRCHYEGPSQLARSPGEDVAWSSGKCAPHPYTAIQNVAMDGQSKSRNPIPQEALAVVALGKPGHRWSTWTAQRWVWLNSTLPIAKLGVVNLEVLSDWTHPYTRD